MLGGSTAESETGRRSLDKSPPVPAASKPRKKSSYVVFVLGFNKQTRAVAKSFSNR
jgi:hypothetical protein